MKQGSSNLPALLFLLAILAAAGAWNYQRNVKLETAEPRPYRTYSDSQLAKLADAYRAEVDKHTSRYRAATSRTVTVREGGYVAEQVDEFERVQRIGEKKRAIATDFAKNQVQLDAVEAEIAHRKELAAGWMLHFQRLTKYP